MKLKLLIILSFLLSIKSIIIINLFIKFRKIINKDFKVLLIYFPVKFYQGNILELIDELKKEKNLEVILGYNTKSPNEVKNYNNAFFINLGNLKYIKNIDIFLSNYVIYDFPDSLNKIYIHHDIYDTPMVDRENEKNLIKALYKCDYIFLSSDIAIVALQKKINEFYEVESNVKKPSLINTGYLKLDHVYQKLKNDNRIEDSVLLAPTLSSMLTDYNLDEYLDAIIKEILNNSKFKLIYRPHPADKIDIKKGPIIKNIYEKFKNNKNFILDENRSYINSYKRSRMLITDFSGTAYTYSFSKLRPIIFFSKNENNIIKSNFSELSFFKDRPDVGVIVQNIKNLNNEIYSTDQQIDSFSIKIELLRSKRIKFFNSSIQENLINLKNILMNKSNK